MTFHFEYLLIFILIFSHFEQKPNPDQALTTLFKVSYLLLSQSRVKVGGQVCSVLAGI